MPWLVYGLLCNLIAIFIFGFPKNLKKTNQADEANKNKINKRIQSINKSEKNIKNERNFCEKTKKWLKKRKLAVIKFIKESKILFMNIPFVFLCIASATEGLLLKGFLNFLSLFFQYQYQISSSTTTIITGAIAIFSVIFGTIFGALIISKLKFTASKCTLFVMIIYLITSLAFWILLLSCKELEFIDSSTITNRACKACNCSNIYNPVCLSFNSQIYEYQSACHAGCTSSISSGIYSNCSCLYNNQNILLSSETNVTVSYSYCNHSIKCLGNMIAGISIAFCIVFLTSVALIPHLRAIIGTIDISKQSFALGLRIAIIRVIGNFTGPIIFGAVIDSACLIWKTNCFNQKLCELYSNSEISLYLAILGFICRFLSFLFCSFAFISLRYREKQESLKNKKIVFDNELVVVKISNEFIEHKRDNFNSEHDCHSVTLQDEVLYESKIYAVTFV